MSIYDDDDLTTADITEPQSKDLRNLARGNAVGNPVPTDPIPLGWKLAALGLFIFIAVVGGFVVYGISILNRH